MRPVLIAIVTALAVAAPAAADPNDPSATEPTGPGVVTSRQAARVNASDMCMVHAGGPASVTSGSVGVPQQKIEEAGPEWVGSDAWATRPGTGSNPFDGGMAMQGAETGPKC